MPDRATGALDDRSLLQRQQQVVLALVVLATVALLPTANDVAMLAKHASLLVGAAVLLVLGALRLRGVGAATWPRHPVVVAAVALTTAALLASAWSPEPVAALAGAYGRYAGGLAYLAATVVLVTVAWAFPPDALPRLAVAAVVATAFSGVYGLLQVAGIDPLRWDNPEFLGKALSTFGNPDFAGAMLAVGLPLAAWGALHRRWSVPARAACGGVAVLTVAAIAGTQELQGWFAGIAGGGVLLLAWVLERPDATRRWALPAVLGVAGLGGLVLALDVTGIGPVRFVSEQSTFASRVLLWRTGVSAVAEAPLLGVGLDAYGEHYHELRPLEEALRRPLSAGSDAAHNVALNLFAGGGLLVGIAFLALLAVVAWCLVVGLHETRGPQRLLLGALGGAWTAYVVQSLVSVEIPSLLIMHAVLAGAVAVLGVPPERDALPLGGIAGVGVVAVAGLVGLVLAGVAVQSVRADLALRDGQEAAANGDVRGAIAALDTAVAAAPWEDQVPLLAGVAALQSGQQGLFEPGVGWVEEALERNPRSLSATVTLARVAVQRGDEAEAMDLYARARELATRSTELDIEVAVALERFGRRDEAQQLRDEVVAYVREGLDDGLVQATINGLRRALDVDEGAAEVRLELARALLADGDPEGAASQLRRAREADPTLEGLDDLEAQLG